VRILLISHDYPPPQGGVQTYSRELALALQDAGHQVLVVGPDRCTPYETIVPYKGIPVRNPILMGLPLLWNITRIVQKFAPDHIIHMQWTSALWLAFPRFLRPAIPVTILVHGRDMLRYSLPNLMRRILAQSHGIIANSQAVAQIALKHLPQGHRLEIIPPGVNCLQFQPQDHQNLRQQYQIKSDAPVILNLTRQVARKNTRTLIDAFALLLPQQPKAILVIAGSGPEIPALKEQAEKQGISSSVIFTGRVPDESLSALYSMAQVFVLSSLENPQDVEGFGMVFIEAAACGTPSIGGRSGGIPDAIIDQETGFLVSPTDAPEIAQRLSVLLSSAALRDQMAKKAYLRATQELAWPRIAQRIATFTRHE